MKKTIGILALFIVLIAGAMLFSGCGKKSDNSDIKDGNTQKIEDQSDNSEFIIGKPWIQVVKEGVFLVVADAENKVLKTGDEIDNGATIETDEHGLANVFFPDGSVARLDSQTKITVLTGDFNEKTKTLTVRIKLVAGNLWSKIMKLATPESVWEVQTTNAVAAVRGTAFGMSFFEGNTRVIGSEHNIEVNPVNPETGDVIESQRVVVEEQKYLEISDVLALNYASGEKYLTDSIKQINDVLLSEEWIRNSQEADREINNRLQSFEESGLTSDQALERYRETIKEFELLNIGDDSSYRTIQSDDSIDLLGVTPTDTSTTTEPVVTERVPQK